MSHLFLDSSALAKRYLPENGTQWIREQLIRADSIIVSRLTQVEIMSAVARRQRERTITQQTLQDIQSLLQVHFQNQYMVIDVSEQLTSKAIELITVNPLRAYDAIQLASAKAVNARLISNGLSPILFLCSDTRLLEFATAEGLATDNPNNYS